MLAEGEEEGIRKGIEQGVQQGLTLAREIFELKNKDLEELDSMIR